MVSPYINTQLLSWRSGVLLHWPFVCCFEIQFLPACISASEKKKLVDLVLLFHLKNVHDFIVLLPLLSEAISGSFEQFHIVFQITRFLSPAYHSIFVSMPYHPILVKQISQSNWTSEEVGGAGRIEQVGKKYKASVISFAEICTVL